LTSTDFSENLPGIQLHLVTRRKALPARWMDRHPGTRKRDRVPTYPCPPGVYTDKKAERYA